MIIFRNNTTLPLEAISIMGLNAKGKEDSIGRFGTGLKYAISVILRELGNITIYRNGVPYEFGTRDINVRNKNFSIVTMNGEDLPFTLEYGKQWEPWMAYRELYSNTKDEDGEVLFVADAYDGGYLSEWETVIVVDGHVADLMEESSKELVLEGEPIYKADGFQGLEIYNGDSEYLYYQGLRAYKLPKRSAYTYNLLGHATLTEDRSLGHEYESYSRVVKAILLGEDQAYIERIVTTKETWESTIGKTWFDGTTVGDTFMRVVHPLSARGGLVGGFEELFRIAARERRYIDYGNEFACKLNIMQQKSFSDAKDVARAYIPQLSGYIFQFYEDFNKTDIEVEDNLISISAKLLELPPMEFAAWLIFAVAKAEAENEDRFNSDPTGVRVALMMLVGESTESSE